MMRRKALMSAHVGDGKQVNTITLNPWVYNSVKYTMLYVDYNAEFPVSSDIFIEMTTTGYPGSMCVRSGTQSARVPEVALNVTSPEITITSIEPQEDDDYIYEFVVEY